MQIFKNLFSLHFQTKESHYTCGVATGTVAVGNDMLCFAANSLYVVMSIT